VAKINRRIADEQHGKLITKNAEMSLGSKANIGSIRTSPERVQEQT
jgi:hypothetical protein